VPETKSSSPSGLLRFGVFQANLAAWELHKHGVRVRLARQPFCILAILLEKPGEVVSREEMRRLLWTSDTFVDFEHSLNSAIKKLRRALGDSPENSRYIETIPRFGYRFVAPVEVVSAGSALTIDASGTADRSNVMTASIQGPSAKRWQIPVAISTVLFLAAFFVWFGSRGRPHAQSKIAPEVHTAPEVHESIDSNRQPALSPRHAEAQAIYLRGLYFWNKRTVTGFQQAIEYFQQATTLDPDYAAAYAGLANSYTLLTAYSSGSPSLYIPQARAAASRALELDEHSAEAHTALALILQNHDWDWRASDKEYRRAIELNPDYATAHHWYAEHLMWLARFNEALIESERAHQLDPLSLIVATDHGAVLYFSRQYDRAIQQLGSVLQKDPNFPRACGLIANAYVEKGMFAQALADAEAFRRLYGDGPTLWSWLGYVHGRAGHLEQARRELEKLERVGRHERVDPATMLWPHLGMGDKEEALEDLERAYAEHSGILVTLKVDPAFDPLRGDLRFQELLRRVGLADTGSNSNP
jgi:DNA-binding winged helix-turn-helix (wHTH) protein/Flp pilus assembly protein TadD